MLWITKWSNVREKEIGLYWSFTPFERRPPTGQRGRDCSGLVSRVKSATCEDGHATATSGANNKARSRATSRVRTDPHLCSLDFLNQPAPSLQKIGNRSSKPSRTSRRCRRLSR